MTQQPGGTRHYRLDGADLLYFPQIFSTEKSTALLQRLQQDIRWTQRSLRLYGKEIMMPRLLAWYADPDIHYRYSGQMSIHNHWTPELMTIKAKVEQLSDVRFNGALLNYYRDGNDSMSWHSDDEAELGINPVIASFSLGARRLFKFRRRDKSAANTDNNHFQIELEHGSLLLMLGSTQHHWQHQITKTRKPLGPRLNITFRLIRKTPDTH